jgi:hypothetical protein
MIRDNAYFTIKELKLSRVAPTTEVEWGIIDRYLLEAARP